MFSKVLDILFHLSYNNKTTSDKHIFLYAANQPRGCTGFDGGLEV